MILNENWIELRANKDVVLANAGRLRKRVTKEGNADGAINGTDMRVRA
jgi:hypothetical protein